MELLEVLRGVLGSFFVLFMPGLFWTLVLFPKGRIDLIERSVLSFGLSLALVTLATFYLNYSFNFKINFINIFMVILGLTALPIIIILSKNLYSRYSHKG